MIGVIGRCALAALLAAGVTATASAGGSSSNGRILLVDALGPTTGLDLFTVEPDGTDRRQLTFDARSSSPALSPNGERVAFLKSDGSSPRDLYVMNADGTGGARLIATHPEATNAGGIRGIAWSPDSKRIAYVLPGSPAIRVIDGRDGTPFPLRQEDEARPFATLEWSPDGSELLYDDGGDIWIKPVDGRPARRLVGGDWSDTRATWSPDGSRIAFVRAGSEASGGPYVVRRDGTDLRHLAPTGTAPLGLVRWKPDGTAVVFDATRVIGVGPRNLNVTESMVLVAGAEGSVLRVLRTHVARPIPSPDNGQILLGQASAVASAGYELPKRGVYVMNADGSCLTLVTASGTGVAWQAAPALPINAPRECVDLVLAANAPGVTGLRGVPYSLVVRNEGTLPATAVVLELRLDEEVRFLIGRSARRFCVPSGAAVACHIDRIEPRQTFAAAIIAQPRTAAPVSAKVTVSASARDSDPASNDASLRTRVYPCWISGTDFNDRLRGTRAGEQICARAGDDVVEALGGADTVDGGWGRDTLDGGSGRDRVVGGRGDDTILARDGERDVIECGWGADTATVDRHDIVRRGCEYVRR